MKNKTCYFRAVKENEKLIVVVTGDPTENELDEVVDAFKDIEENSVFVCSDRFKFIIVPKDARIEVIKKNAIIRYSSGVKNSIAKWLRIV
jgi:hypothetical protein